MANFLEQRLQKVFFIHMAFSGRSCFLTPPAAPAQVCSDFDLGCRQTLTTEPRAIRRVGVGIPTTPTNLNWNNGQRQCELDANRHHRAARSKTPYSVVQMLRMATLSGPRLDGVQIAVSKHFHQCRLDILSLGFSYLGPFAKFGLIRLPTART